MNDDNQDKNREPVGQTDHETHIPAILFLVVLVGAIAVVMTSMSQLSLEALPGVLQQPTQNEQDAVEYVEAKKAESTDDMPSGIFFGDSNLVQNRTVNLGGDRQRIVVYDTDMGTQELLDEYRDWFSENGYDLSQESTSDTGGSIVANKGEKEIVVVLGQNENASGVRVQFNYVVDASA